MVDELDSCVRNKWVWAWLGCQDADEDSLQVLITDLRDYFYKAAFNFLQTYNSIITDDFVTKTAEQTNFYAVQRGAP